MNLVIVALAGSSAAMRVAFAVLLFLFAAWPALAASDTSFLTDNSLSDSERYSRCLDLAGRDPETAYELSFAWHARGGTMYAEHCEAVALVNLKRYPEAARRLAKLAAGKLDNDLRVQLYIQAGNAWMMAEEPGQALPLLSDALEISPGNMDALIDRARARAMHHDWAGAETDLTKALSHDPTRADLYVLRSSALHAMGKKAEARADIDRALEIVPGYAEALVERGGMKLEAGDTAGAKADWEQVLKTSPTGDAADAARKHLRAMGVKLPPA